MNKPTRFYSKIQEKQVAKVIKGRTTANSGATPFSKGDVINKDWCIECKTTTCAEKASMSIKKEWLQKNREEAFAMGKPYNALAFNYGLNTENYYIIDEKTFSRMRELFDKEDNDGGWIKPW